MRLDPIARDHHVVRDVVLLQCAQGQGLVVGLSSTRRMNFCAMRISGGQSVKKNVAPLPGCGLRPDPAAVLVDDALHGGQADAGARELPCVVKSLERAEQLAGVGHVEAHAVVAHEIGRLRRRLRSGRTRCAPAIAAAVNFQALSSRFSSATSQQPRIALGLTGPARWRTRPGARARNSCRPLGDLLRHRRQVDILDLQLRAGHARQLEQVVDQQAHALGSLANPGEMRMMLGRQSSGPASSSSAWLNPSIARSGARRSCDTE